MFLRCNYSAKLRKYEPDVICRRARIVVRQKIDLLIFVLSPIRRRDKNFFALLLAKSLDSTPYRVAILVILFARIFGGENSKPLIIDIFFT